MTPIEQLLTTGKVDVNLNVTVDNKTLIRVAIGVIAIVVVGVLFNRAIVKHT